MMSQAVQWSVRGLLLGFGNSGERETMLAYHRQFFPYEVASDDVASIDRELRLSLGTGGFVLKQTESMAPTSIVGVFKEQRRDQFARAAMTVEAAAPHRVVRFEIHPVPTPDQFLSAEELQDRQVDDATRRVLIEPIATELEAHRRRTRAQKLPRCRKRAAAVANESRPGRRDG
jgi:hypothetical protein